MGESGEIVKSFVTIITNFFVILIKILAQNEDSLVEIILLPVNNKYT